MPGNIILYSARICPFGHRAEIALAEAKAEYTLQDVNLRHKPDWFLTKVNPVGRVPAMAYGGPKGEDPANPSPESVKLNESLILVEFVADLFPESGLHPKDPVKLAKARLFVDAVANTYVPAEWAVSMNGEDPQRLADAMEHLQSFLPSKGFVLGDFSMADVAIAPYMLRMPLYAEHDLGGFPEGEGHGQRILEAIRAPKLARFHQYMKDLAEHPSVKSTFYKDECLAFAKIRYADVRADRYGAHRPEKDIEPAEAKLIRPE